MLRITLKAARVNAGLAQKEAAKKLKISNKTLASWENGASCPKANQVEQLCELYGVSYNEVIFFAKQSP